MDAGDLVNKLLRLVPWNGITTITNNSENRMRQKLEELRASGVLARIDRIITVVRMPEAADIAHWFS